LNYVSLIFPVHDSVHQLQITRAYTGTVWSGLTYLLNNIHILHPIIFRLHTPSSRTRI
jgi:hypothetical protein